MLLFDDLTVAQRKWVVLVEHFHPEVVEAGEITHRQIHLFHEEFYNLRDKGKNYKVGLPLWLIKHNTIRRGVYKFPGTSTSKSTQEIESDPEKQDDKDLVANFLLREARKFGLDI